MTTRTVAVAVDGADRGIARSRSRSACSSSRRPASSTRGRTGSRAALARGHQVTVLARLEAGAARDARTTAGYGIIRVPVAAIEACRSLARPRDRVGVGACMRRERTAYRPPPATGAVGTESTRPAPPVAAGRPATRRGRAGADDRATPSDAGRLACRVGS